MIVMTMRTLPLSKDAAVIGSPHFDEAVTEWNGGRYVAKSKSGASMALARALVAAGCPDQPWECRNPEGRRTLSGKSLHGLARFTIEGDRLRTYQDPAVFVGRVRPDGVRASPRVNGAAGTEKALLS